MSAFGQLVKCCTTCGRDLYAGVYTTHELLSYHASPAAPAAPRGGGSLRRLYYVLADPVLAAPPALPPGWTQYYDEHRRAYYGAPDGTTTWDLPVTAAVPPSVTSGGGLPASDGAARGGGGGGRGGGSVGGGRGGGGSGGGSGIGGGRGGGGSGGGSGIGGGRGGGGSGGGSGIGGGRGGGGSGGGSGIGGGFGDGRGGGGGGWGRGGGARGAVEEDTNSRISADRDAPLEWELCGIDYYRRVLEQGLKALNVRFTARGGCEHGTLCRLRAEHGTHWDGWELLTIIVDRAHLVDAIAGHVVGEIDRGRVLAAVRVLFEARIFLHHHSLGVAIADDVVIDHGDVMHALRSVIELLEVMGHSHAAALRVTAGKIRDTMIALQAQFIAHSASVEQRRAGEPGALLGPAAAVIFNGEHRYDLQLPWELTLRDYVRRLIGIVARALAQRFRNERDKLRPLVGHTTRTEWDGPWDIQFILKSCNNEGRNRLFLRVLVGDPHMDDREAAQWESIFEKLVHFRNHAVAHFPLDHGNAGAGHVKTGDDLHRIFDLGTNLFKKFASASPNEGVRIWATDAGAALNGLRAQFVAHSRSKSERLRGKCVLVSGPDGVPACEIRRIFEVCACLAARNPLEMRRCMCCVTVPCSRA